MMQMLPPNDDRPEVSWWWRAAQRDQEMASTLLTAGYLEGTAFHAQQAAQKALKALLAAHGNVGRMGRMGRIHASVHLLTALHDASVDAPESVHAAAKRLDLHYINARYPNGVGGTPEDFYDQALAEELLAYMETVLTFVAGQFEL